MKPVPHGEPYAGKLHVRFDEGAGVPDNKGRPALLYSLKTAYAEGGRAAVSNKIEKLVETGDLSRKQAAKLHEIAQGVYDHVVEKLEAEIDGTAK